MSPMAGRRRTSTSNFGVGARESHDSTAFYERFRAPDISDDATVLAPPTRGSMRTAVDDHGPDPDELEEGEPPATPDEDGLRRFLEATVMPWFDTRKKELANRPLIREQAFGEALDPDKLERLGRYEVHLDRKLERMLAMLLRLKDLRAGAVPG